jgi:hypothetical protein
MVYLSQVELSKLLEFIAPGLLLCVLLATTCSGNESTFILLPDVCVVSGYGRLGPLLVGSSISTDWVEQGELARRAKVCFS